MQPGELPQEEDPGDEDLSDAELDAADAEIQAWIDSQDPAAGLDTDPSPPGPEWVPVIDLLQGEEREEFRKRLEDLDGWNKGEVSSI